MSLYLLTEEQDPITGDKWVLASPLRGSEGPALPERADTRQCPQCRRVLWRIPERKKTAFYVSRDETKPPSYASRCRDCEAFNKWHKNNIDRAPKWTATYRQTCKRYGLVPTIETFTEHDVIGRWGRGCFWCGDGAFEHLDHVTEVREGGPHTLDNVRPSCGDCNRRRGVEYMKGRRERETRGAEVGG